MTKDQVRTLAIARSQIERVASELQDSGERGAGLLLDALERLDAALAEERAALVAAAP